MTLPQRLEGQHRLDWMKGEGGHRLGGEAGAGRSLGRCDDQNPLLKSSKNYKNNIGKGLEREREKDVIIFQKIRTTTTKETTHKTKQFLS